MLNPALRTKNQFQPIVPFSLQLLIPNLNYGSTALSPLRVLVQYQLSTGPFSTPETLPEAPETPASSIPYSYLSPPQATSPVQPVTAPI